MHRIILFAYTFVLGIETGAGLFSSVAVYPVWTASPEIVATWKPSLRYFVEEGDFFMYGSSATMLMAIIVVLAFVRRRDHVRRWALGSALAFLGVAVWTFAYFLPMQGEMHGDAGAALPPADLASMLESFVALNWIRQAVLVTAFLGALHALGLKYRSIRAREEASPGGHVM